MAGPISPTHIHSNIDTHLFVLRPLRFTIAVLLAVLPRALVAQATDDGPRRVALRDELALLGKSAAHTVVAPLRWHETQLRSAGRVLVGLAALSSLDAAGRSFMRDQQAEHWDDLSLLLERFGTVENYTVLGGFYAAGVVLRDGKARAVAVEGIASSVVAGALITPTLQFILGRSRPRRNDGVHSFDAFSGNISLPSGHTTQAFAVASVIATEYDHPAVQIAAYGLAGSVATARMYHDAHFLSDVTAAAIIGTVVGRTVARFGRSQRQRVQINAVPGTAGGYGLRLTLPTR